MKHRIIHGLSNGLSKFKVKKKISGVLKEPEHYLHITLLANETGSVQDLPEDLSF